VIITSNGWPLSETKDAQIFVVKGALEFERRATIVG
jgi:hypothetical protein